MELRAFSVPPVHSSQGGLPVLPVPGPVCHTMPGCCAVSGPGSVAPQLKDEQEACSGCC